MILTEVDMVYTALGQLLDYPHEDVSPKIEEAIKLLDKENYPPEFSSELREFLNKIKEISLDDLQGLYSYTFEFSSDLTLDLGYHTLEGFNRAQNLVNLKEMYKDKGFPYDTIAKGELPDHLAIVLKFLGFIEDEQLKIDFRESFVIKTLEKLSKSFEKNQENPYFHLIRVIYRVLDKDIKEVK